MNDRLSSSRLLRSIDLRDVLSLYGWELGPLTVNGLGRLRIEDGFAVGGRPSKVISDALRGEIGRGRVRRVGRGRYELGRVPRGTAHRIRRRVKAIRAGEPASPWGFG